MSAEKNPKPISLEYQIFTVLLQKHRIVESDRLPDGRIEFEAGGAEEVDALDAVVATLNGLRSGKRSAAQLFPGPTCTKCGCTEESACFDGCSWTTLDKKTNAGVCTSCTP